MQNTGSVNSDESQLKAGDKFDTPYPFRLYEHTNQGYDGDIDSFEVWVGGCHKRLEPSDCGYGEVTRYVADAEGRRVLTVLAVVDMPGKWQRRILYSCTMIPPTEKPRLGRKAFTVTESRFKKMIGGYFTDYEVEAVE
ncbi:hypothetical protein [Serratia fonticola]